MMKLVSKFLAAFVGILFVAVQVFSIGASACSAGFSEPEIPASLKK